MKTPLRDIALAELELRKRDRLRAFPDFGTWLYSASPGWSWHWPHLVLMQQVLDRVTAGELTRVMFFMPPRHGKSEQGTVRYPVYRLERDPAHQNIIACFGQSLADKMSRKARKLAKARVGLSKDRTAVVEWETTAGGGMRAVGVGGPVTGTGAHLITIDDPVKSRKQANSDAYRSATYDWYTDDIYTRLEPGGAIVLTQTRWHDLDLAGQILASEDGPNWFVLRLPAIAETQAERDDWATQFGRPTGEPDPLGRAPGEALCPERYDLAALEKLKLTLRTSFWALFQQRPRAKEGGFFQRSWLPLVSCMPPDPTVRIRWWDRAASKDKGDFTAGVRLSRGRDDLVYIEHVRRGQWAPNERDAIIRSTAETDPPGTRQWCEQEPGSSGVDAAAAFVRLLKGFPARFQTSTGSKEDRADAFAAWAAAGNVRVVDGPWAKPFIDELTEFPTGSNDDQVDAGSGAFNKAMKGRRVEVS